MPGKSSPPLHERSSLYREAVRIVAKLPKSPAKSRFILQTAASLVDQVEGASEQPEAEGDQEAKDERLTASDTSFDRAAPSSLRIVSRSSPRMLPK